MNTIIFNFSNINTIEQFYESLKEELDIPDYFGHNLDALYDVITSYIDLPINIVFNDFKKEKYDLFEPIINVFLDSKEELCGELDFNIKYK